MIRLTLFYLFVYICSFAVSSASAPACLLIYYDVYMNVVLNLFFLADITVVVISFYLLSLYLYT